MVEQRRPMAEQRGPMARSCRCALLVAVLVLLFHVAALTGLHVLAQAPDYEEFVVPADTDVTCDDFIIDEDSAVLGDEESLLNGPNPFVIFLRPVDTQTPMLCPTRKPPEDDQAVEVSVAYGPEDEDGEFDWSTTCPDAGVEHARTVGALAYAEFWSRRTGKDKSVHVRYTVGETFAEAEGSPIHVFDAELTLEGLSGNPQDPEEENPGAFVLLDGPRRRLDLGLDPPDPCTLRPNGNEHPPAPYTTRLTTAGVDLYTKATGGDLLTDREWGWQIVEGEWFDIPTPTEVFVQPLATGTYALDLNLTISTNWPAPGVGWATDKVVLNVVTVDLDIEGIDGPDHEIKEDDPGGFMALGGGRRKILLSAAPGDKSPVRLKVTSGGDKVVIYEGATGGDPLTGEDLEWETPQQMPGELWVQPKEASGGLGDIELKLSFDPLHAADSVTFTVVEVDLEVYDSQGGPKVQDEVTRGAFAVANLNDTDSDGNADHGHSDVDVPDERDLIRVVLKRPVPDLGGSVALSVTGDGTTTSFWRSDDKAAGEEEHRSFATNALPLALWLEGSAASGTLRDVVIACDYATHGVVASDEARATFVWAQNTNFRNSGTSLSPDADGQAINETFRDQLGSKLGLQISVFGVLNSMEMEFEVRPSDVTQAGNVVFDVTRQREARVWHYDHAQWVQDDAEQWPAHDEQPNDDDGDNDEDNVPHNSHIYSVDSPGLASFQAWCDFCVMRANFYEFGRVRFDGQTPSGSDPNERGSRCSSKAPWHSLMYVRRNGRVWERDNDQRSCSTPVFDGTGQGGMTLPTLGTSAVTEAWTATFEAALEVWAVAGTVSGVQTARAETGKPYSSDDGQVSFTIWLGQTPFANGDKFDFSTFVSAHKGNEVEEGHIDVTSR